MPTFQVDKPFGSLQVNCDGEQVNVAMWSEGEGQVIALTRDEATMLLSDLSSMLCSFVPAE
jgi:hypothetical protein